MRAVLVVAAVSLGLACVERGGATLPDVEVKVSGPRYEEVLAPLVAQQTPPAYLAGPAAAQWSHVRAFYALREHAPLWLDDDGLGKRGRKLIDALCPLSLDGLDPAAYRTAELERRLEVLGSGKAESRTLVELELLLTAAYLRAADDLQGGRIAPRKGASHHAELPFDVMAALKKAARQSPDQAFDAHRSERPEYRALAEALEEHRELAEKGGWPILDRGPLLAPGKRDPRVKVLRERLAATGELADASADDPELYDERLEKAVKAFQRRHGLAEDGKVAGKTLAALRVPVEKRIEQLQVNLERWRWLPADLGERYVLVNTAAFELQAYEGKDRELTMKVINGRHDWPTPSFSGTIEAITVNPDWVVPERILKDEVIPAMQADPEYAARNGMQVEDRAANAQLDPATMDWAGREDFKDLRVRQPAGPGNPLGRLKFEIRNPFMIYLHDTNAPKLFGQVDRALSHGCVRLEDPLALAKWVSQGTSEVHDALEDQLSRPKTRRLNLEEEVPVHLLYFTAWKDEDGQVHFREDIYRRDRVVLAGLKPQASAGVGGSQSVCR